MNNGVIIIIINLIQNKLMNLLPQRDRAAGSSLRHWRMSRERRRQRGSRWRDEPPQPALHGQPFSIALRGFELGEGGREKEREELVQRRLILLLRNALLYGP